jgi:hypothetical protein
MHFYSVLIDATKKPKHQSGIPLVAADPCASFDFHFIPAWQRPLLTRNLFSKPS